VDLAALTEELLANCRATEGVTTLAVFGSASSAHAGRRDEWSDLDFAVFATPERADAISAGWPFLPRRDEVVLTAREFGSGGAVVYADGTVLEFGAGHPWEISDPTCEVLLGGDDLHPVPPPSPDQPENAVRLFLVKLLIGMGRVRRGEVLAGGVHLRVHALGALTAAVRGRLEPVVPDEPNPFDAVRRFEIAYPELGAKLAAAVELPAEAAGLALFRLARAELEPGWTDFPSRAADVVAQRLGWVSLRASVGP
jgi:hypothetical protein